MDQAYVGEEPEVKAAALRLAGPILKQRPPVEVVESLKLMLSSGVRSDSARVQIQTITAALWPALDCLKETTVYLISQVSVRRNFQLPTILSVFWEVR